MTERRRRGASRSSNCFQTSSAFGFLAFIVRSRVGIRGVESFTSKRKDKDLTPERVPTGSGSSIGAGSEHRGRSTEVTEKREVGSRRLGTIRTKEVAGQLSAGQSPSRGDAAQKKKKGESAVGPQFHPGFIIPERKHFASTSFKEFYVAWAAEHEPRTGFGLLHCAHEPKLNL